MRCAFTLVELLVVVTIIVVLLALMVPALDQAVYQAELAICAAQLGSVGRGVLTYAADHKRRYPIQPRVQRDDEQAQPHDLAAGFLSGPQDDDMRSVLKSMFDLKIMVDPLCPDVDLDTRAGGANVQLVMGSYCVWFGWQYRGYRGMFKVGDQWEWDGPSTVGGSESRLARFDLLASDRHHLKLGAESQVSHPDAAGFLRPLRLQDETNNPWLPQGFQVTFSAWFRASNQPSPDTHGALDMNYGHDDGSVSRILAQMPYDSRTFPVPERRGNVNPTHYLFAPPRQ